MRADVKGETSIPFIDKVKKCDMIWHKKQRCHIRSTQNHSRSTEQWNNHYRYNEPPESHSKKEELTTDRTEYAPQQRFSIHYLQRISSGPQTDHWMIRNHHITFHYRINEHINTCYRNTPVDDKRGIHTDSMVKWPKIWMNGRGFLTKLIASVQKRYSVYRFGE